jgi:hypothetical protein
MSAPHPLELLYPTDPSGPRVQRLVLLGMMIVGVLVWAFLQP